MAIDPWRNRARRTLVSRLRDGLRVPGEDGPHYVVCGADPLAYRLVRELSATSGARVTVIVPHRRRIDGPDVAKIKGVRLIRAERLDSNAFWSAGLDSAGALALVHQDDVGNIHAALCAQEVNRHVRLVIRMFDTSLAQGIRRLFKDCAVMSDADMAAPAFVAAALGEVSPSHVRIYGRMLRVASRAEVEVEHVVCGLADTTVPNRPAVLPAADDRANLVLAEASGLPAGTVLAARRVRRRQRPVPVLVRALRAMVNRKIGMAILATLTVVAIAGLVLAATTPNAGGWHGLYLVLLTTITGAEAELAAPRVEQVAQVVLTVAGLALVPLSTAAVVDAVVNARMALDIGRLRIRRKGHVVVVGLGNVGTRVLRQLHDLGVEVVAVDRNPAARGVPVARRLDFPVIVGDGAQEETLRAASVETCQALVVVSTDDVTNLRAALNGTGLRADLRVVLRLFDGDFADRIQAAFNFTFFSSSVSYLAAPAFAAAMMERDVITTIPVDRHVLLVAEVPVAAGSELDGGLVGALSCPDSVRVIALTRFGDSQPVWSPPAAFLVRGGDRLTVVARRAGLTDLLARAQAPAPAEGPQPRGGGG